jgi:hypothetical protein
MRATAHLAALARLREERHRARQVLRHPRTLPMEYSEPRTSIHGAPVARLPEQPRCTRRVPPHAGAVLVEDAEPGAPAGHATVARHLQQLGAARVVAKDVLAPEESEGEVVAGLRIPQLAVAPESLRFLGFRMARRQEEDRARKQDVAGHTPPPLPVSCSLARHR